MADLVIVPLYNCLVWCGPETYLLTQNPRTGHENPEAE